MFLNNNVKQYLSTLEQQNLLRRRLVREEMTHFDSNDYLSLTRDSRVVQGYIQGYELYPSGSGASGVLSGYHQSHKNLERAFSDFLQVDNCMLFSSGYAANIAISLLLGQINAHCLIDKAIHASIYDGLKLASVHYSRYIHNNMNDLSNKLKSSADNVIILTEGIFSMSGQRAPLDALARLSVPLIVDEAHSFGILGEQGRGAVDEYGLGQDEVPLRVIPFGKTMASQGALVAGRDEWIQALLQAGRSFTYSTSISPALCYGLQRTLDVLASSDERRLKLNALIKEFKSYCAKSPLNWMPSDTAVQQLQLGCPQMALDFQKELIIAGISCSAIRTPTVSIKNTGLRIILNYQHESENIQTLFEALHRIHEHSLR